MLLSSDLSEIVLLDSQIIVFSENFEEEKQVSQLYFKKKKRLLRLTNGSQRASASVTIFHFIEIMYSLLKLFSSFLFTILKFQILQESREMPRTINEPACTYAWKAA
jgi:hypothetical protein